MAQVYQLLGACRVTPFKHGSTPVPSALDLPLKWRDGRLMIANGMSERLHENLSEEIVERIFWVISEACEHRSSAGLAMEGRTR